MTIVNTKQYIELFNRIAPKLAAMNFKKIDHYHYADSRYRFIKDLEADNYEDLASYDTDLPRQRGFRASRLIWDRPTVWLEARLEDSGAEAYWVFEIYGYPGTALENDPEDPNGYTLPYLRYSVLDISEDYLDKIPEYADRLFPKYDL